MYMNAAFDNVCFKGSVVSQSARFVYLCLCKHADNTKQTCFPSLNRIAEIVGKSISTIKRAIRELIKYGAVERTPRFRKDGGQTSNLYKIKECNMDQIISDQPEINQDQASSKGSNLEVISLSVSEDNSSAPACTAEPEENNGNALEIPVFENDLIDDINNNSRESDDSTAVALDKKVNPVKKHIGKLSVLDNINRFRLWIKDMRSGLHTLKAIKFGGNEPGGGHGRPSRNLYN